MNTRGTQETFEGREVVSIHIGGVHVSHKPIIIRTVLGSCISVCLRDSVAKVGGMNHFMLPNGTDGSARYGIHAMELLINECMKQGADRRRLEAKVFGGGHVLQMRETDGNVPKSNIRFAEQFLKLEDIPVLISDVGGYEARKILFFPDTGRALLKRLPRTSTSEAESLVVLENEERTQMKAFECQRSVDTDSNITLF